MDTENEEPLVGATVALYSPADSSLVTGTTTDSAGAFALDSIPCGDYALRISFVGFATTRLTDGRITRTQPRRDLETITLSASTEQLSEVTVSAERPAMDVQTDRTVYNTSQQVVTAGGSARMVLEDLPSIQVDIDGSISYRGNEGVRVAGTHQRRADVPLRPVARQLSAKPPGRGGSAGRGDSEPVARFAVEYERIVNKKRGGIMKTRVSDILRHKGHDVVTGEPTDTVLECIATMVQHNVGSMVIIDDDQVAGIFTERDYLRRIALKGRTSRTTRVEEVMTKDVLYVEPGHTIDECLQIMTSHKCRHLPVVTDGQLDGIVSIGDCVKQISRDAQSEAHTLKAYITGKYPA